MKLRHIQMEEMKRAMHEERAGSFHALSRKATLPAPPRVHQPRSSSNPVLLGFYGGFVT